MWTPATRQQHSRPVSRYQTDLTDAEWRSAQAVSSWRCSLRSGALHLLRVRLLKQRFGPVAPTMKFVHWVCKEMDQGLARYSV